MSAIFNSNILICSCHKRYKHIHTRGLLGLYLSTLHITHGMWTPEWAWIKQCVLLQELLEDASGNSFRAKSSHWLAGAGEAFWGCWQVSQVFRHVAFNLCQVVKHVAHWDGGATKPSCNGRRCEAVAVGNFSFYEQQFVVFELCTLML